MVALADNANLSNNMTAAKMLTPRPQNKALQTNVSACVDSFA